MAVYDFPAEQSTHLRSGNPIASTFATVRLGTDKPKGCLSRETALAPDAFLDVVDASLKSRSTPDTLIVVVM